MMEAAAKRPPALQRVARALSEDRQERLDREPCQVVPLEEQLRRCLLQMRPGAAGHPVMGLALGAVVLLVAVGLAAGRSRKPVRMAFSAALTGMGALGAVNLLAPLTGVSLALNWATSFMAVVLGAPGVITLLLLDLLLGL